MNIDFAVIHKSYKKLVLHSQTHSHAWDLIACSSGTSYKTMHGSGYAKTWHWS